MIIDTINYVGASVFIEDALRDLPFSPHSIFFQFRTFSPNPILFPKHYATPAQMQAFGTEGAPYELSPDKNPRSNLKGVFTPSTTGDDLPYTLSQVENISTGDVESEGTRQNLASFLKSRDFEHIEVRGTMNNPRFNDFWPHVPAVLKKSDYSLVRGKVIFGEHRYVGEEESSVAGQLYFNAVVGGTDFDVSLNFTKMLSPSILSAYSDRFNQLIKKYGPVARLT